jgi:hypothetical protein
VRDAVRGQRLPLATFANTTAGHKKFIRWATKGARAARVCLEATGIYLRCGQLVERVRKLEPFRFEPRERPRELALPRERRHEPVLRVIGVGV